MPKLRTFKSFAQSIAFTYSLLSEANVSNVQAFVTDHGYLVVWFLNKPDYMEVT